MNTPTDNTDSLEELIHEFMSHTDVDFGYAVGNLNMDTTPECRNEIIKKLKTAISADRDRRIELERQKEQVRFMAALLREFGGKIEISRKSLMEADIQDQVIVHDDIARNKVVYELAALGSTDKREGDDE